uniref:Centrosomal protein of 41 kDa n=1 Tax=Malurus cyaneus samueli TaxID=2593467 RepID=A0A8C5TYE6_9PASS
MAAGVVAGWAGGGSAAAREGRAERASGAVGRCRLGADSGTLRCCQGHSLRRHPPGGEGERGGSLLTRRIPSNPKYQHIKTRLDTGNSMSKYMEKLEEIKRNYRYKKDELFKRLKVTTFAQLVIQVASLSNETLEVTNEELQKLQGDNIKGRNEGTELEITARGELGPAGRADSS